MGLFGNMKKNTRWFFTDDAKKRFANFKDTFEPFLDCFKENAGEPDFHIAFEWLAKGDIYSLKFQSSKYKCLEYDNILKFVTEFFDALCEENGVYNKIGHHGYSSWKSEYYFLMTYVCLELLKWELNTERNGPYAPVLSYPEGLKLPNNQIFHILLTLYKSDVQLDYSTETRSALFELLDMVGRNCEKPLHIIEPQIFENSFYRDIGFKDEFVDRIMSVVNKYQ